MTLFRYITTLLTIMLFIGSMSAQLTYENVSDQVGFGQFGGLTDCIVDMNGDYLDDIVVVQFNSMTIFYQQEDGSFSERVFNWNFNALPSWSITAGDINGDGFNDLVLGDGEKVGFFMSENNGNSYFEVTFPEFIFAQRSTLSDIDQDGHLDAFVCNDVAINHVYRNMGDGTLQLDISMLPTADMAGNYANLWTDYDNDGDQDLLITKCLVGSNSASDPERINLLYRNNGDETFTEVGASANMNDNAQSWVTNMEDYDNDGDFDAFIANHDFANRFMINNGDGTFTDIIDSTGINKFDLGAWGSNAADYNNDGFVDIMLDTERKIYLNNGDLTFTEVEVPFGDFNRGAVGDLNNDGSLDFIMNNKAFISTTQQGNWLKVNLKGYKSNSNGIGARLELHGEWGMQSREIRSGESYASMSHLNGHFGIGEATSIDSLVVKWPSGIRTVVVQPDANTTQFVEEFECLIGDVPVTYVGSLSLCPGEEISLSGPNDFAEYLWSNGETTQSITVNEAGSYNLQVTSDDGCVGFNNEIQVTAIDDSPPTLSESGEFEICAGEEINVSVITTQSGITWSNGLTDNQITITETGEYFVETTSQCNNEILTSESVFVNVVTPIDPIVTDVDVAAGDSATLMAEGENLFWYASETGSTPVSIGNTFTTPVINEITTYYVESIIVGPNGTQCRSNRVPVTVGLTSTEEIIQELGIDIYPNPATALINIDIELASEIHKIQLFNNLGQLVSSVPAAELGQSTISIDLLDMPTGNYTLKMNTSKGVASKNIIVTK